MREELIKLLLRFGHICKGEAIVQVDTILKDFLVLRKSEAKVYEVNEQCEDCPFRQSECESARCGVSQVIVISKEK